VKLVHQVPQEVLLFKWKQKQKEEAQVKLAFFNYVRCFGVALTKAHNSLLRVLIGELQSKVAASVDPNSEPRETQTRRGRRKDI
jgi:hypothetical protein